MTVTIIISISVKPRRLSWDLAMEWITPSGGLSLAARCGSPALSAGRCRVERICAPLQRYTLFRGRDSRFYTGPAEDAGSRDPSRSWSDFTEWVRVFRAIKASHAAEVADMVVR